MNTVARFETALIEQFQRTGFPSDAPMQVCFERDAERHAWHVVAKRLGAFSLHHRHPDVERHLFFDEQKNIYIRCRPNFHGFSQRAHEVISRALCRCRAKNDGANGRIFYKKISPADAGIIVEQAAQLLALRWEAFHATGVVPL